MKTFYKTMKMYLLESNHHTGLTDRTDWIFGTFLCYTQDPFKCSCVYWYLLLIKTHLTWTLINTSKLSQLIFPFNLAKYMTSIIYTRQDSNNSWNSTTASALKFGTALLLNLNIAICDDDTWRNQHFFHVFLNWSIEFFSIFYGENNNFGLTMGINLKRYENNNFGLTLTL